MNGEFSLRDIPFHVRHPYPLPLEIYANLLLMVSWFQLIIRGQQALSFLSAETLLIAKIFVGWLLHLMTFSRIDLLPERPQDGKLRSNCLHLLRIKKKRLAPNFLQHFPTRSKFIIFKCLKALIQPSGKVFSFSEYLSSYGKTREIPIFGFYFSSQPPSDDHIFHWHLLSIFFLPETPMKKKW